MKRLAQYAFVLCTLALASTALGQKAKELNGKVTPFVKSYCIDCYGPEIQRAGEHTLLDRSMVLYTSYLGNSSSHDNTNLPILLAGGGLRHRGHIAYDRRNNTLLSNLYVRMMQQMGLEARSFGASTAVLSDV